jgi:hypothetical protein
MDDIALYWLGRHALPEVVVVFLRPRGNVDAAQSITSTSRQGFTAMDASWRIVKLWELPAEQLLAAGDIGLVPWVPPAQFDGPPVRIMRECRARIDQVESPIDQQNLLAVTQLLARLRYNEEALFEIFGGRVDQPLRRERRGVGGRAQSDR